MLCIIFIVAIIPFIAIVSTIIIYRKKKKPSTFRTSRAPHGIIPPAIVINNSSAIVINNSSAIVMSNPLFVPKSLGKMKNERLS